MTKKTKLLYLDLEGVLVNHKALIGAKLRGERYIGYKAKESFVCGLDMSCVDLMLYMLLKHQAQICLTSTLRTEPKIKTWLEELFAERAPYSNYSWFFEAEWRTGHEDSRETEILAHVHKHGIESWVAIDDRKLGLTNFVWISPYDGLSLENYANAEPFIADNPEDIKPELIFL